MNHALGITKDKARMARAAALLAVTVLVSATGANGEATCAGGFPEGSGNCGKQQSYDEYKKADKALNEAYQNLLKELKGEPPSSSDEIKAVISLQRQWLQFRDAWCAQVRKNFKGGDQWGITWEQECLTELTKHRTDELQSYGGGG